MRPSLLILGLLNALMLGFVFMASTADLERIVSSFSSPGEKNPDAAATKSRPSAGIALSRSVVTPDEMLRRPLFDPDRRPPRDAAPPRPEAPRANAEAGPTLREDIRLIGVATIGARQRALIRLGDDPQGRWLEKGATVEGWRLVEISSTTATLLASGRTLLLRASTDRNAGQAAVPTTRR